MHIRGRVEMLRLRGLKRRSLGRLCSPEHSADFNPLDKEIISHQRTVGSIYIVPSALCPYQDHITTD
jgi:hypothetical protein